MGAAAAPLLAGSALGGGAPLTGALMGGLSAGAALPAAAAATGATAAALPTAAFTGAQLAPALNMAPFAMNPAGLPAIGGISSMTAAGPSTGLIPSSVAPSFMENFTGGLKDIGQFAQNNPVLTNMAMQGAQGMLQQPPSLPPAGLMRGNPTQVQRPPYNVGVPQVSLIQVVYGYYRLHP